MKRIFKFGTMAIMLATFAFVSCSKDNDDDEPKTLSKKVTRMVAIDGDYTTTCYFDSEGRVTSTQNEGGTRTWTYQYSGNKITSTLKDVTDPDNNYSVVWNYTMENGRIVSEESSNGSSTYNYSADGYITSIDFGSGKTNFIVKDGLLESINSEEDGVIDYEEHYTYGQTKNNLNVSLWFTIFDDEPLFTLMGTNFEKLPSSKTSTYISESGKRSYLINYNYEYDGDYLTKIICTCEDGDDTATFIWEIFYE